MQTLEDFQITKIILISFIAGLVIGALVSYTVGRNEEKKTRCQEMGIMLRGVEVQLEKQGIRNLNLSVSECK